MAGSLTPRDRERIDVAVKAIEARTAAHLAVVVIPASDRYALFPLVWGQLGALMIVGMVSAFRPGLGIRASIMIQVPAAILLTLIFNYFPIRVALIPKRVRQSHARRLAHNEFAVHVAQSTHRNLVLIFVSIGERYVEVIADRGIHPLVPDGTWDKIVGDFLAQVRGGRVADGVVGAIEACGALLAEHHPIVNR